MSKPVTLRRSGNSLVLTAPSELKDSVGRKYHVEKKADGTIIYHPADQHNIFASPDWLNYDYQRDLNNDPELQSLPPVGKERLES